MTKKPRAPRKPKKDAEPKKPPEQPPEPDFFDDLGTALAGGKDLLGLVTSPPPKQPPEAKGPGLFRSMLGDSFGWVGKVVGGGLDVTADAFAAQNQLLMRALKERDEARADARVLLAFYETNAFVDQEVRDRVRTYPEQVKKAQSV